MNYQKAIESVANIIAKEPDLGRQASYIEALKNVDADKFGIYLTTISNQHFSFGDYPERFSIQSIAKVISLVMAYDMKNELLWERVGVEPSGTRFNSLVQLEVEQGVPRNPLINAGAIVVCDVLISELDNPKEALLSLLRKLSKIEDLTFSEKIASSEWETGYRNMAVINLMKDLGNIKNDVNEVLDLYFNLCSIEMSCQELSQTFLFLANAGVDPITNERIISVSRSKRINAIMQLCGFYDEAGEFAFRVGLPGKSGVGGGIIAVHPGNYSLAVWSPKLNPKGNSHMGMRFLEEFTTVIGTSIY